MTITLDFAVLLGMFPGLACFIPFLFTVGMVIGTCTVLIIELLIHVVDPDVYHAIPRKWKLLYRGVFITSLTYLMTQPC